ncbi:MAG: META domain-containing protein [Dysgonamonadaceae bacterium]|jgi:hypothetical protein|nr:META domain-containing protein [Dysgonamonadaceae bacterium]
MKTLKFLLFAVLALSMVTACSENDTQGTNNLNELDLLKSQLNGEWVASGQKNSYIYIFADNDTVYIKTQEGNTVSKWPYLPVAEDSIRIIRNWTTHSKVVFYSGDSIWISNFIPSLMAVYPPEFSDIVLVRAKEASDPDENPKLTDIKWKLTSFVSNGNAKTPEPDSNDCYWLIFDDDNTLEGKSSANFLLGSYEVNHQTSSLRITNLGGTEIYELPDGRLFVESLMTVRSFELQEAVLKLYYNETDYLLFNSDPEFVNPYRETVVGKWKLIQIVTVYNSDTQNPEIIDYSNDNIIYDFLTDNRLEVSGGLPDDLAEGEYFYHYQKPNVGILSLPAPNLTIDGDNQLFCIAPADNDTMTVKGEKITGRVVGETGLIVEQGTVVAWTKTFAKLN